MILYAGKIKGKIFFFIFFFCIYIAVIKLNGLIIIPKMLNSDSSVSYAFKYCPRAFGPLYFVIHMCDIGTKMQFYLN